MSWGNETLSSRKGKKDKPRSSYKLHAIDGFEFWYYVKLESRPECYEIRYGGLHKRFESWDAFRSFYETCKQKNHELMEHLSAPPEPKRRTRKK